MHQNLTIMTCCSQGNCLLFDFLDLLTEVYLLGHRSLVSQALERHRFFSCVTITALVPPPGWDCSIDLRCYEINKSNEA